MEERAASTFMRSYGKYIITIFLFMVVGYVLLSLTYRNVKREMIEGFNAGQLIHAKQAAGGIETFFYEHAEILLAIAKNKHIVALDETGKRMMHETQLSHKGEVSIVTLIDSRGRILHSEPYDRRVIGQPVTKMEDFLKVKRTHQITVSDVFTNRRGFQSIIVHAPVFRRGSFDGTLAMLLSFDFIAKRYIKDIRIGKDGYAWMVSRDGIELSCPVPGHVGNSVFDNCREFPDILAMAERMVRGEQGVTTYMFDRIPGDAVSKTTKHAVFMPIRVGDNFWSIVVATPEDEMMGALSGFRDRLLLIAILLVIGIGFFLYMLIKTRIVVKEAERKRETEEALRESEEKYRSLASTADSMYLVDRDCRFLLVNERHLARFGLPAEQVIGRKHGEFHSAEAAVIFENYVKQVFETGESLQDEYRSARDGRYFVRTLSPVKDDNGMTSSVTVVAKDITERKQAEEALRESEEKYRAIIENMEEGYHEVDIKGNFTFFNESIRKIMGYEKEELLGINNRQYADEENARKVYQVYNQVYRTGVPVKNFEWKIIRKDGDRRDIDVSISLIRDGEGHPTGFRGIVRDITERKRAEEEKRILEERLQHADKMEAIGTLAGGIAHDFNNLLMGIQGYASLMLLDLDPSHPHYERLKRIEEQVQSGADLTKQLLGFARGGRYEVKPADMNDIIKKTSSMFGRTKKEISIHRKYGKDLRSVEVDRGQMEQVFMNLYVNAWQAMPGGGEIYLETENVLLDDEQAVPYAIKPGKYVKITVTDTGTGMDEKTRERIFDPFFTTRAMGRGTGLGLATVYGIIKGHTGMINVYSEPGHGTTFNIYLPASEKEVVKEKTATGTIARGTETILLVDDEKMVLEVSREMLEFLGYQVYAAGSGQEAIAVYMEKRNKIDLVILDMIMPGISGGETFDRLREIDPDAKVLLSSVYSINGEAKTIMDRGCSGFIQKPFQLEKLSGKVREMLG